MRIFFNQMKEIKGDQQNVKSVICIPLKGLFKELIETGSLAFCTVQPEGDAIINVDKAFLRIRALSF